MRCSLPSLPTPLPCAPPIPPLHQLPPPGRPRRPALRRPPGPLRPPHPTQLTALQRLLSNQLTEGAAGLSLGLGYYPSSAAPLDELVALASVCAAQGRLVCAHVRDYTVGLLRSVDEFVEVLTRSGAAGLLSHLQAAGQKGGGGLIEAAMERLVAARREGIDVTFDMYPYTGQPHSSTLTQHPPPAVMSPIIDKHMTEHFAVDTRTF